MKEEYGQWGDIFPNFPNTATRDPRVFQTPWEKMNDDPESPKVKKFFACVVGKDCYGVDVIRPWATDAKIECLNAVTQVKVACNYYELHGEWPKASE